MALSTAEKNRLKTRYGAWALITGASSGIGKELAERIAESGLNLCIVARRKDALDELASAMRSKYYVEVVVVEADLSQQAGIDAVLKASQTLDIGLLVASAGFGTSGLFVENRIKEEQQMLAVNCTALFALTHHFSRIFQARKKGGIILLSSLLAFQGVPYSAHYAATKAYVQSLAEGLYHELKPFGVDVLAAAPGPVSSSFAEVADMQMSMVAKPSDIGIPILKALGRASTVLPGFLSKFLAYSLSTAPRWGKVRFMQFIMGGMTEHQRKH
ncbi:MAG: SDR family NAD(P)-dependent oxidoreductase [Candidatus Kapaibacteriota bacterium]